jgi:putative ABC transport system permease protein
MFFTIDEEAYNRVIKPVEGMAKISLTFMIVVLILGGLILLLLASLAIRERKYEVGVLRAMGMKKHKVALGLICESLAITMVCLLIGLSIGTVVAQPVSDVLLQRQVENAESSNTSSGTGTGMFFAGTQQDVNAHTPLTASRKTRKTAINSFTMTTQPPLYAKYLKCGQRVFPQGK